MPTTAQDRTSRGPFAALLILLSLCLGSAPAAAAGADLRGPTPRLGSGRHAPAAALLPASARSQSDDEASGSGPSLLPSLPGIVTEALTALPGAETGPAARVSIPKRSSAFYRARAPPAS